jgi:hypothetical protein
MLFRGIINGKAGKVAALPKFFRYINPISTRGADYGHTLALPHLNIFREYTPAFSKRLKCFCVKLQLECFNSVQKALDLETPAKNRRKLSIIDLNFQIKKLVSLTSRLVWNWPSKLTTHSLFFCEM